MSRIARLLVALVVVAPVGVAVAFFLPEIGGNTALVVGWMLTALVAGVVLWPSYGDRTMGWPLVLVSAAYFAIVVAVFAVGLSSMHDSS